MELSEAMVFDVLPVVRSNGGFLRGGTRVDSETPDVLCCVAGRGGSPNATPVAERLRVDCVIFDDGADAVDA